MSLNSWSRGETACITALHLCQAFKSFCKVKQFCMEEQTKLGSPMTSDIWKENNCRFFNSWSPIMHLKQSYCTKLSTWLALTAGTAGSLSWDTGNTRRDQDQAASFHIPQFLGGATGIAGEGAPPSWHWLLFSVFQWVQTHQQVCHEFSASLCLQSACPHSCMGHLMLLPLPSYRVIVKS